MIAIIIHVHSSLLAFQLGTQMDTIVKNAIQSQCNVHFLGESSQNTIVKKQKSDFGDNGMYKCVEMQDTVGIKKEKRNAITLEINDRKTTLHTTHILHKTTDRTTLNSLYR